MPPSTDAAGPTLSAIPSSNSVNADYPISEIKELARGLQNDPLRIFNFVRNKIRYEHYYGCKKGAAMTLLEKSGNDFDQCALLVSLLRVAAITNPAIGTVSYKYGRMTIPATAANQRDFAHWLGYGDMQSIGDTTIKGGWPHLSGADATILFKDNTVGLARVCVGAMIDGTARTLDPSFKAETITAGININAASGYNRTTLLTQAGGTSTPLKVSGMNPANLRTYLGTLATNLTNSLKIAPANGNATLGQVIGGRQIVAEESVDYTSTVYFPWTQVLETWAEIPGEKASTIEVRAFLSPFVWTMPLAELRGRRLSLTFAATSPKRAQIWLDDVMQVEETGTAPGTQIFLETRIIHPFRDINVNQSDIVRFLTYKRSVTIGSTTFPGSYAIVYAFDAGADHVRLREEKLAAYRAQGLLDSSRQIRTEILNLMGLHWMRQTELAIKLIDRATDTVRMTNHRVGRVGQDTGCYLDISLQIVNLHQMQGDAAKLRKSFELGGYVQSALEHGVVEQFQNGEAVSTVDLITRALTGGGAVNRVVTENETRLQPAVSSQTIGAWKGTGYAAVSPTSLIMSISGGLNGGFSTLQATGVSTFLVGDSFSDPGAVYSTPPNQPLNFGADPVDLATGAFTYNHTDLALGGSEPRGLTFARHYSSRLSQQNDAKLGYGWTHQYYLRAHKRSDAEAAFGMGTPAQAAAALVAVHAAIDVYDIGDPKKWATAMLSLGWAVDQVDGNAVSIQFGERNLQFLRQPSGVFLPPPGLTMSLVAVGTGYELTFRHGNKVIFDANGRGTIIRDHYNKELKFAYNADGTLKTVTDCYARVLTLTYTAGKLTSVSDGTGRVVSFGQSAATDLSTYTDPEGKTWRYDYLAGHLLEKTRDPDNRVIVQNIYDLFDRVKEQRSHGDETKTWKLFYSNNATVEQNPLGGLHTYLYDEKHQLAGEIDANARKTTFGYDGLGHRTSVTTPDGETTTTVYDANDNPSLITDPLSKTTQFFYDSQLRPDYTIDGRGKTWAVSFNAYHQPWKSRSPKGVSSELVYYTSGVNIGLLWKKVVEGTFTTTFEYDSQGFVNKITYPDNDFETFINNTLGDVMWHTDRRGFVTGFQYNQRRELTFTFLPTVNGANYYLENVYDNEGNLWKQYDRYRNLTTQTYSATQKPLVTTFANNETFTQVYDKRDWMFKTIDCRGKQSRTEFFPDGQVQRTYDRLNRRRTDLSYDANGQPLDTKSPAPNAGGGWVTSTIRYNARGEIWKAEDAFGVTTFTPDANGNLRFRKDRRNNTWEFTYNDDGQLEDTISPNPAHRLAKRYDARGLLQTVREPSGDLTTVSSDALGRVDNVTDPVGNIHFTYDDEGRVDTIQENAAAAPLIDRTYDALGRLTAYRHGGDYVLKWIYHDTDGINNNAFTLRYPGNKDVRYDFDNRGRLKTVKDWNSRITTYDYDSLGRLEWTHRPNRTSRHVSYDDEGQITKIEELSSIGQVIALFSYPQYWGNGQPAKQYTIPSPPQGVTVNPATMTFDSENRLATWNGQNVVHDDDGNMTNGPLPSVVPGQPSPGLGSFRYDARNRLLTCNGVSYNYDAENLRTKVTTGAGSTRWIVSPASALAVPLVRINPDGTVTRYIWGLGLLYEEDGATQETKTYHYDRRGSTVALTNRDGRTVTDQWSYGPYGERLSHTGISNTPFQFNGFYGVQTDTNGLLYMNARYYSVETRRFISADPMRLAAGANFYSFVDGDPIMSSDPLGLFDLLDGVSIGVGFIPLVGTGQSVVELISGRDYITGEPANRWLAAVGMAAGLVPGGKGALKGGAMMFGAGAKNADEAVDLAKAVAREGEGVIYKRIDPKTGAEYIGQSIDDANYAIRQYKHDAKLAITHDYQRVASGRAGVDLHVLEEAFIRSAGGLRREGGLLLNGRHQLNAGSFVNQTNGLLRGYQGQMLLGNGLLNGGFGAIGNFTGK